MSKLIVRRKELPSVVGLSPSTCRRLEMQGKFPRRFKISETLVGWDHEELLAWKAEQQRERAPLPTSRNGSAELEP